MPLPFRSALTAVLISASALLPSAGFAQDSACARVWSKLSQFCDGASNAWSGKDWDLYLSGISHHGRKTYTQERLNELNERALGGGLGKRYRDEAGRTHLIYGMAFQDSHYKPQYLAGYAWLANWEPRGKDGFHVGAGFTAMITARTDYSHYHMPVPAVLPVAEVGWKRFSLMGTYIPRLSSKGGNGDVLFLFTRASF